MRLICYNWPRIEKYSIPSETVEEGSQAIRTPYLIKCHLFKCLGLSSMKRCKIGLCDMRKIWYQHTCYSWHSKHTNNAGVEINTQRWSLTIYSFMSIIDLAILFSINITICYFILFRGHRTCVVENDCCNISGPQLSTL